jgi:hypothetical protein
MDKDLAKHKKITTHQIETIEKHLVDASPTERTNLLAEARSLYRFHVIRVRDFQHERLIHLMVTFFFGVLWLLSVAGGLYALTLAADPSGPMLNILAWALCPLLFITELFYVAHYYKLENGTQALYDLTKRLYLILNNQKS